MAVQKYPLITQGERFGHWVTQEAQPYTFINMITCKCDCGTKRKVQVHNLRSGHSKSCGCLTRAAALKGGLQRRKHPIHAGEVYGRLTVIDTTRYNAVECKCECGNTIKTRSSGLYTGTTKSCGCLHLENAKRLGESRASQGGASLHSLYGTWKRLTMSPYKVYEPWQDPWQFIKYVEAELGPRPDGMRLMLKDKKLGYMPGNLHWTTGRNGAFRGPLAKEERAEILELIQGGSTHVEVAKAYGVSSSLVGHIWRDRPQ